MSAALFDTEKHRSSLGIEADLFGDEEFITNREAFDKLQEEHIFNVCQDYRQQGYYDVVYAKDQYHWDMPELRGCLTVYNEEDYDISEMIIVVTYNTMRYALIHTSWYSRTSKKILKPRRKWKKQKRRLRLLHSQSTKGLGLLLLC